MTEPRRSAFLFSPVLLSRNASNVNIKLPKYSNNANIPMKFEMLNIVVL